MSFNKTCVMSGIPILEGDKVRVLFMLAVGDHHSSKSILATQPLYPWSGFKLIGGMSVSAILGDYNEPVIYKKDLSYHFINEKINNTFGISVQLEEVEDLILEGKMKKDFTFQKNSFLNIAYIKEEIYIEMISIYKKDKDKEYKRLFEELINKRDSYIYDRTDKLNEKNIEEQKNIFMSQFFSIGFFKEYTIHAFDYNFFSIIKRIDKSLTDENIFNLLKNDILFMYSTYKQNKLLAPSILIDDFDNFNPEKERFHIKTLNHYLNSQDRYFDNIKSKNTICIIKEIHIKDLISFFSLSYMIEYKPILDKFIIEYGHNKNLLIEKKEWKKYPFIKYCLEEFRHTILIIFK